MTDLTTGLKVLRRVKVNNAELRARFAPAEPESAPAPAPELVSDSDLAKLEAWVARSAEQPVSRPVKPTPGTRIEPLLEISREVLQSRIGIRQWANQAGFKGSVNDEIASGKIKIGGSKDA